MPAPAVAEGEAEPRMGAVDGAVLLGLASVVAPKEGAEEGGTAGALAIKPKPGRTKAKE